MDKSEIVDAENALFRDFNLRRGERCLEELELERPIPGLCKEDIADYVGHRLTDYKNLRLWCVIENSFAQLIKMRFGNRMMYRERSYDVHEGVYLRELIAATRANYLVKSLGTHLDEDSLENEIVTHLGRTVISEGAELDVTLPDKWTEPFTDEQIARISRPAKTRRNHTAGHRLSGKQSDEPHLREFIEAFDDPFEFVRIIIASERLKMFRLIRRFGEATA